VVYEDVLAALADAHVGFVVTGGVAVALHGLDRSVPDLDIVVDPEPANLENVAACLARLGFWPTLPLPLSSVIVMRTIDGAGREVDVNRIYIIPFSTLRERATAVLIQGREVLILSRDDLIAVKQKRGRDYDLDDVRLLQSHRDL
jgi:predicted nucleotidyltransferase